jgi:molecular chaperone DnaK
MVSTAPITLNLRTEEFDIVLVNHILAEFKKQSGIDLKEDRMAIQ